MDTPPRLRMFAFLGLIAAAAAGLILLPVKEYLERFGQWVRELGDWGPVLLAAAYVPATVLLIPGTIMSLMAGAAFGVVRGTIAVSAGSTVGAAAAFLVGRSLARDWVESMVAGNPRFRALDQAVAREGFKIVLLTRLSPAFPFTLLNYAFGLTRVRFRDYLLASWVGMLPATVMYVYLGSAAKSLLALAADLLGGNFAGDVGQKLFFFVGLAATVAVTVLVTRLARRALSRAVPDAADEPAAPREGGEHE
jgi:uncharacterized membrane protein YdjX (TVP38/TMEM64 family)